MEQRPWWPDALQRFEQLAQAGEDRHIASRRVAEEYGVGITTTRAAIARGSVACFPSNDPERAVAWNSGESRYEGKVCKKHMTRIRYTNDGVCVECMAEYVERNDRKRRK